MAAARPLQSIRRERKRHALPGPTSGGRDLGESQSDVRGRPVLCRVRAGESAAAAALVSGFTARRDFHIHLHFPGGEKHQQV